MSRTAEAVLVLAAAALAGFGVLLVNYAEGRHLDAWPVVTFLVFAAVFGGLLAAVRAWASRAVPFLIPLGATITAVGFVVIYRLDKDLAGLQRWWLLVTAGLAALWLYSVRTRGLDTLQRHRYGILIAAGGAGGAPAAPVRRILPRARGGDERIAALDRVAGEHVHGFPARRDSQVAAGGLPRLVPGRASDGPERGRSEVREAPVSGSARGWYRSV